MSSEILTFEFKSRIPMLRSMVCQIESYLYSSLHDQTVVVKHSDIHFTSNENLTSYLSRVEIRYPNDIILFINLPMLVVGTKTFPTFLNYIYNSKLGSFKYQRNLIIPSQFILVSKENLDIVSSILNDIMINNLKFVL